MHCPKCQGELSCALSIRTVDSDRPIYYSHQWWSCKGCVAKYFAILEDSKVNIFDDSLEHRGYHANPVMWAETLEYSKACPSPSEETCTCKIHADIHASSFMGEWAWHTNS